MANRHRISVIVAVVLLVGLLAAALHTLFSLRISSGDIFPEYSSYRAGPKGCKILYRALSEMPGLQVERRLKDWDVLEAGQGNTLLVLGSGLFDLEDLFTDNLNTFALTGGRLVVAFAPDARRYSFMEDDEESVLSEPEEDEEESFEVVMDEPLPLLSETEVCRFTRSELQALDDEPVAVAEEGGDTLPWYGGVYFENLDPEWTVLYRFSGKPVVIERSWKKGSLVLLGDSYLFSNEAMVLDRRTPLLARLLGDAPRILFDESHLGVVSQENLMMLAARYRLRGVLIALLVLAGLFVWQRMSGFIPRYTDEVGDDNTVGAWVDSSEGFTNLLLRHVPAKELGRLMVKEWDSTFSNDPAMRAKHEKLHKAYRQMTQDGAKPNPLTVHNQLIHILNERK